MAWQIVFRGPLASSSLSGAGSHYVPPVQGKTPIRRLSFQPSRSPGRSFDTQGVPPSEASSAAARLLFGWSSCSPRFMHGPNTAVVGAAIAPWPQQAKRGLRHEALGRPPKKRQLWDLLGRLCLGGSSLLGPMPAHGTLVGRRRIAWLRTRPPTCNCSSATTCSCNGCRSGFGIDALDRR